MVTRGARQLGRTIRKLEDSIEFSAKESKAKTAEIKRNKQVQETQGYTEDSFVQNLRSIRLREKPRVEK